IITAATSSSEPLRQAMQLTRKRGRVVVVGAVGMSVDRSPFYEKEIDLKISCSYGPGRYDPGYEAEGRDYPYAFVRWTENRNMQAYLQLIADGRLDLDWLTRDECVIDAAPEAYARLRQPENRPMAIVLRYAADTPAAALDTSLTVRHSVTVSDGRIRVGLIGAGAFATDMHLPNIAKLSSRYVLSAVASHDGVRAKSAAVKFGASRVTTEPSGVISADDIDMVLITTRHDSHAELAVRALEAGKSVFLEKPLALNRKDMRRVIEAAQTSGRPFTVGFNRRFSPLVDRIRELTDKRTAPMIIDYQMNAGLLPSDHWTQTSVGGGRNIGEACHIYDLFTCLTGAKVRRVQADTIGATGTSQRQNGNFVAVISFDDGSVCTLTYTGMGSKRHPKEQMRVYCDESVIVLDDYRQMRVYGREIRSLKLRQQDKGHLAHLRAFADHSTADSPYVIPLWQLVQATEISFEVEDRMAGSITEMPPARG
ncbi:MAG: Gfo/Idh/MocA family oxidoreductase, partial [candidate division Zixibacteria bacterium]|nr:Gfo/Idh/MocA family oxidoreductase [candidate division Zixibacteria bacterium]